jgi:hypothetical protein
MDYSLIFIVLILVLYVVFWVLDDEHNHNPELSKSLEETTPNKLLPIMDPKFNMRECAKQIILLEDHLFNPKKRCQDCIKKHFMTIEGLAEEASTLDKTGHVTEDANQTAHFMRQCQREFVTTKNYEGIGQKLRECRKPLMYKYFESFNT